MTEILAKLFARGNRSSNRFYADRSQPLREERQLVREKKTDGSKAAAQHEQSPKKTR